MILVVCPKIDQPGGVANFYRMLSPYLSKKDFCFFYLSNCDSRISRTIHGLLKYLDFCSVLAKREDLECVLLNPSLGFTSFVRDSLFCFFATCIYRKKTAIFWHGWNNSFSNVISKSPFFRWYFRHTFGKSHLMYVLSPCFKDNLAAWGYRNKIIVTYTCIEDLIVQYSDQESAKRSNRFQFLFLSRLEPDKGAEIVLDSFFLLQKKYNNIFNLVIAGDGSSREKLIQKAKQLDIRNVSFPGNVTGQQKIDILYSSDVFCFPSSHGEGMPCALLEAMGAGLSLITSGAGGVEFFFQAPEMGYLTHDLSVDNFSNLMEELYLKYRNACSRNLFNQKYAKRFLASTVSENLAFSLRDS